MVRIDRDELAELIYDIFSSNQEYLLYNTVHTVIENLVVETKDVKKLQQLKKSIKDYRIETVSNIRSLESLIDNEIDYQNNMN